LLPCASMAIALITPLNKIVEVVLNM
jgi:hypothetical protein